MKTTRPPHPGPKPPSGLLAPDLYSNALANTLKHSSVLQNVAAGIRTLDAKDHWGPTAEDFSEAVAWMRLLGLTVSITIGQNLNDNTFWISRRGGVPWKIDACDPTTLITTLKNYAKDNPVPENAAAFSVEDLIRAKRRLEMQEYHDRVKMGPSNEDIADAFRYGFTAEMKKCV